jgi:hypothetical protein
MNRRTRTLLAAVPAATAVSLGAAHAPAGADSAHARHLGGPVYARSVAPHNVPMARNLTGAVIPNAAGPSRVPVPADIDGCDHAYGALGQCVPWAVPGGDTVQRCAWLSAHGFTPLTVTGRDRQHLDPDHDKLACAPDDLTARAAGH